MIRDNRAKGVAGETMAKDFFRAQGYRIEASNYRVRSGEVDFVASRNETLVFVEVKTRARKGEIAAVFSVDRKKRDHIRKVALCFIREHPSFHECDLRFDVVSVILEDNSVEHFENAFV
ncbi:MAG: YraN family protein [Candidatus Wallbacteria bacterium]|nr:YraN family protein [Candidatus Wallbacteria bacterium]